MTNAVLCAYSSNNKVIHAGGYRTVCIMPRNMDRTVPSVIARSVFSLPMDNAAAGLMRGQHEHLGYLHVRRGLRGIQGHIGNIIARERLDALVYALGTCLIAVESNS